MAYICQRYFSELNLPDVLTRQTLKPLVSFYGCFLGTADSAIRYAVSKNLITIHYTDINRSKGELNIIKPELYDRIA